MDSKTGTWNAGILVFPRKEKPGSLGGATRVGVTAEGGRRKIEKFSIHLVHGQHADLSQLFVGEKGLFLFARALFVS
jgi:hypothetical protein